MSGMQRTVQRLVHARLLRHNAPEWVHQTVAEALWDDPVTRWREWLVCLKPGVWDWAETTSQALNHRNNGGRPYWVFNLHMPLNDELHEQLEQFRLFPARWDAAHPAHIEANR